MNIEDAERQARDEGRPWPPPFPGGSERPDPLAPPAGYGVRPEDAVKPDLSICSHVWDGVNCPAKVDVVIWMGCSAGEHAGPMPYCYPHGRHVAGWPVFTTCGQCQKRHETGWMKILKIECSHGTDIPLTEHIQRSLDVFFGQEGDDNDANT